LRPHKKHSCTQKTTFRLCERFGLLTTRNHFIWPTTQFRCVLVHGDKLPFYIHYR